MLCNSFENLLEGTFPECTNTDYNTEKNIQYLNRNYCMYIHLSYLRVRKMKSLEKAPRVAFRKTYGKIILKLFALGEIINEDYPAKQTKKIDTRAIKTVKI